MVLCNKHQHKQDGRNQVFRVYRAEGFKSTAHVENKEVKDKKGKS